MRRSCKPIVRPTRFLNLNFLKLQNDSVNLSPYFLPLYPLQNPPQRLPLYSLPPSFLIIFKQTERNKIIKLDNIKTVTKIKVEQKKVEIEQQVTNSSLKRKNTLCALQLASQLGGTKSIITSFIKGKNNQIHLICNNF